jgi:hypothetical protein
MALAEDWSELPHMLHRNIVFRNAKFHLQRMRGDIPVDRKLSTIRAVTAGQAPQSEGHQNVL